MIDIIDIDSWLNSINSIYRVQSERERVREQAKQKKKKEEEERSICLRPSTYVTALQVACDHYQGMDTSTVVSHIHIYCFYVSSHWLVFALILFFLRMSVV